MIGTANAQPVNSHSSGNSGKLLGTQLAKGDKLAPIEFMKSL